MTESFRGARRAVLAAASSSLLLAGGLAGLLALGAPARSLAATPLRLLIASTVNFSSDGGHYVAWEAQAGSPITLLNTQSGLRRQITLPAGCKLGNDSEDASASSSAAGRFLLSCTPERSRVLDVRSGASVLLSAGTYWYRLGTRYAQGNSASEHQVVENLASGAVKRIGETEVVDLDRPGAPGSAAICSSLRGAVRREGVEDGQFAYRDGVFAQQLGQRGDVRIRRCTGAGAILRSPFPAAPYELHQPRYFDLRGGVLTWDTGELPDGAGERERGFRSRLTAYRVASGRARGWTLPRIRLKEATRTTPPVSAGYSAHTADAVFWIATRTLTPTESGGVVATASVYSARL